MPTRTPSPPAVPLHISLLVHLLLLLYPLTTTSGITVTNTTIPGCPSFNCGNGLEIRYPFWIPQEYYCSSNTTTPSSSSFCGRILLKLTCKNNIPSLNFPSGDYFVTDIDYVAETLNVTDADFLNNNNNTTCPRPHHNLTFEQGSSLNYPSSDSHLTFFFNCSVGPPEHQIPCLASGNNRSYVFLEGAIPTKEYDLQKDCEDTVVVPVLLEAVRASTGGDDLVARFGGVWQRGFQLDWGQPIMEECRVCENSGGWCSYNGSDYVFSCSCKDGSEGHHCRVLSSSNPPAGKNKKAIIRVVSTSVGGLIIASALFFVVFLCKKRKLHSIGSNLPFQNSTIPSIKNSRNVQSIEAFLATHGSLNPKRYHYSDVEKMTKSFSETLGQGGYGTVFKGKLRDGRQVAVKILTYSKGNGEEFVNEVASIGRTSHINIVSLLGFCAEASKRALIYEFMPNGSLEKFIYVEKPKTSTPLGYEKLYEIAIGIARGLEYLHIGCSTRIVHFDIKPHNILLDQDFCPKIADFGLAKLCSPKQSILSMQCARGTAGYIAPEVFSRNFGVVSTKADVYSYGMMILEMVGGRNNIDEGGQSNSEFYFPHWIYEHLDRDGDLRGYGVTSETEEITRKMILVGLWCIQTNPGNRPSMSRVVEMLEGSIGDLQMPLKA